MAFSFHTSLHFCNTQKKLKGKSFVILHVESVENDGMFFSDSHVNVYSQRSNDLCAFEKFTNQPNEKIINYEAAHKANSLPTSVKGVFFFGY
jgi:hypothetical protein